MNCRRFFGGEIYTSAFVSYVIYCIRCIFFFSYRVFLSSRFVSLFGVTVFLCECVKTNIFVTSYDDNVGNLVSYG